MYKDTLTVRMFVWNTFENDARVLRECLTLSENGYSVELVCLHQNRSYLDKFELINENFRVYRIPDVNFTILFLFEILLFVCFFLNDHILSLFLFIFMCSNSIKKYRILFNKIYLICRMSFFKIYKKKDIYHANDLNTLPQTYFQCKLYKNTKFIYDSHEIQTSRTGYNSSIYKYVESYFMKRVDVCIHENSTRAKYTQKKYHRNIHTLHNYPIYYDVRQIPRGKLYEKIGVSQEIPIFLYQGGIQKGRGLNNILEAAKLIDEGVFVFVGNGKEREVLKERTKKMGITEKIFFVDKVPYSKLKLYTVDAFLGFQVIQDTCFNHYSASSNKLFEYILSEIPVIGSDLPEISKVIKKENVGITINPESVDELVRAIKFLLNNRNYYLNLKKNCRTAKFNYTWNNEQKYLLNIYNEENHYRLLDK